MLLMKKEGLIDFLRTYELNTHGSQRSVKGKYTFRVIQTGLTEKSLYVKGRKVDVILLPHEVDALIRSLMNLNSKSYIKLLDAELTLLTHAKEV